MAYDDVVDALSPTYRWKLNNNLNATTGGVNMNVSAGSAAYAATIIPQDTGNCIDATDLELGISNQGDINDSTTTRKTLSLWFQTDTVAGTQGLFEEGGGVNWCHLYLEGSTLYWNVGEGNSTQGHVTYAGVAASTTYHVVAELDCPNNILRLYVNGGQVASTTHTMGTSMAAHSGDISFARTTDPRDHNSATGGKGYFNGRLADICYWAEADALLSPSDVLAIYEAGSIPIRAMIGGFAVAGISGRLEEHKTEMLGGVSLSGTADTASGGNTQFTAVGGVAAGGAAGFSSTGTDGYVMSGGAAAGGVAGQLEQHKTEILGGIAVGGAVGYTPPEIPDPDYSSSGGLVIGGEMGQMLLLEHTADIGVAMSGEAIGLVITPFPPMTMAEGVAVGGTASLTSVFSNHTMGGGIGMGSLTRFPGLLPPTRNSIQGFGLMPALWEDIHGSDTD